MLTDEQREEVERLVRGNLVTEAVAYVSRLLTEAKREGWQDAADRHAWLLGNIHTGERFKFFIADGRLGELYEVTRNDGGGLVCVRPVASKSELTQGVSHAIPVVPMNPYAENSQDG